MQIVITSLSFNQGWGFGFGKKRIWGSVPQTFSVRRTIDFLDSEIQGSRADTKSMKTKKKALKFI